MDGKNDELTAAQKKRLKKKAAEAKKEATAPSVTSVESGMHSSPHAYLAPVVDWSVRQTSPRAPP